MNHHFSFLSFPKVAIIFTYGLSWNDRLIWMKLMAPFVYFGTLLLSHQIWCIPLFTPYVFLSPSQLLFLPGFLF